MFSLIQKSHLSLYSKCVQCQYGIFETRAVLTHKQKNYINTFRIQSWQYMHVIIFYCTLFCFSLLFFTSSKKNSNYTWTFAAHSKKNLSGTSCPARDPKAHVPLMSNILLWNISSEVELGSPGSCVAASRWRLCVLDEC